MIYTQKIQEAILFSIKTHELHQKQKRKGKDIPYITHPLTVGLILAKAGANEDVIIAGILHDTIEDSIEDKKVTVEMVAEKFGENVANLVASVTEFSRHLPWEVRKQEAVGHIKDFPHDSLLVKSGDIISNATETINDFNKEGEVVFDRFGAPKNKVLEFQQKMIIEIINKWPESPLASDLQNILGKLVLI